jgi:group I intron endonuclease
VKHDYCGVYKITHRASGKAYVGKAVRICFRWYSHKHDMLAGKNLPLHNALRKYGMDAFDFDVVERCDSDADALEAEKYWIEWYGTLSPNGYNLTEGGEGALPTDEVRRKISESKRGKKRGPQTPEWTAKIAAKNRGKVMSPEAREKMRAATAAQHAERRARGESAEWSAKMSTAAKIGHAKRRAAKEAA